MKDWMKFAIGAAIGFVGHVVVVLSAKKMKIHRTIKEIKEALEQMGLEKYNTQGKKIAQGNVNRGTGLGYIKLKSIDEVDQLSKGEINQVNAMINEILEREQPKDEAPTDVVEDPAPAE